MLKSLYVENFKSLLKSDITLSNLTLISGLNGVGKSSLNQVLLLVRESYLNHSLFDEGLLLKNKYINIGQGKDALTEDASENWFKFILDWEDKTHLNLFFDYSSDSNLQPINQSKSKYDKDDIKEKALFSTRFQYLSAERIAPRNSYDISDYGISNKNSLGKNGELTIHYLAKYQSRKIEERLMHPKEKINTLIAQVDAWMSEISPGIKITAEIKGDINQATLHYQFETSLGYTKKFNPINVGFGLTYVLPVVTAILSAKPADLLIIENPEAHLHPAGQTVVGRLISIASQNGIQIIVESHSDHLLNGIRVSVKQKLIEPENVALYYFERSKSVKEHIIEITRPFIDADGKLDEWPNGFFDEWEIQLDNLLE